ncbi:MAG: hypothetical protein ACTSV3_03845 [Candidatus Thorarchaeota archaeon]|nr:MAG: hypothetical protein DRP09_03335 [Candidatus Thorarchaeota archaeon]RLI59149.1 MAG: hypothetical protein DRO87_03810 [Candidatus Thorarchaeota archaeon]
MGRTVRTFRDAIRIEERRWKGFRRTLRPDRRDLLDRVFDYGRGLADAGTMVVSPRVMETVLLSAVLEILNELDDISRRLSDIEGRLEETAP